ncbi:MAG TPA: helix-turn-helix transcriptional regulator [Vicinamibacteria bacterium]|nr:helix-turn-helix transcriptional regulator [Vicinamibacteria bacterium]
MTRIEAERRRRGWNQTTLAFHSSTTQAEISRIECGLLRPTPRVASRIAGVLGLPADRLLDEVGDGEAARG